MPFLCLCVHAAFRRCRRLQYKRCRTTVGHGITGIVVFRRNADGRWSRKWPGGWRSFVFKRRRWGRPSNAGRLHRRGIDLSSGKFGIGRCVPFPRTAGSTAPSSDSQPVRWQFLIETSTATNISGPSSTAAPDRLFLRITAAAHAYPSRVRANRNNRSNSNYIINKSEGNNTDTSCIYGLMHKYTLLSIVLYFNINYNS